MDLALTDEQEALVSSFRQLLDKGSSAEQVREAEPHGFDERLWDTLVDTGAVVMAVAEDRGGWGASVLDLALVAEQLGRRAAPAPVIEAQVAARLLAAAAPEALEPVLAGEVLSLALHAPIEGLARLVPGGSVASSVIVLDGDQLLLVPVTADDRQPVSNLASAPLADVAVAGRGTPIASGGPAIALFESAVDEWLALTASALVGLATSALEIAYEYARERKAFGAPIGTFQGVSHPLADAATSVDGARLLAHKAAWALDMGSDESRELAAMSFAFSARAAEQATYHALHVHGGYGFMLEYDVQLFYRRARGWSRVWGDAEAAYRRAADARYGTAGRDS